jgi:hypothetical protein
VDLSGAAWRTSTYSGGNGGQCVEVAALPGRHDGTDRICAVRDSKNPGGPALAFGHGKWQRFTAAVKAGTFGLS